MSDENTPAETDPAQEPANGENAKADETDWQAEARKWEKRAKENFEKAQKFDEVEESQKSELQKLAERAEAAERRAAEAEHASLRSKIAAELDVPVEVLRGDDEKSLRESAEKVIAWRDSNKKPTPKPAALKSGASGSSETQTGKERAAAALRQLRSGA